jgi:nucleoside-diphosphate-sugar epimerase
MRIALTGATGFVGGAVLDEALRRGWSVRALTRRPPPRSQAAPEWIEGDLANRSALAALAQGQDAVIHVAGLTTSRSAARFDEVNLLGTQTLMEAVGAASARRFVFVSSLAAREPSLSAYGASKAKAERLVEATGLDAVIVRPPAVYGPRDTEMLDLFRAASRGIVPLPPGGATSIVQVQDLARLLLDLAQDRAKGRATPLYEPDDGRSGGWSHRELAHAIGLAVGRRSVLAPALPRAVLQGAAMLDRLARGDRAKLTLDRVGYMCHPNWVVRSDRAVPVDLWQPKIEGLAGLAATADWYRAKGWL